jgi:hypothetical protein
MYEHRGLPLFRIEYFGAAAVNVNGSLTAQVQDRQVCSWLMGAPFVFTGDLASLSDDQMAHYRERFVIIGRLQDRYGIYRCFQFSGVPEPTDTDWHWWGKLNEQGSGAVVIMRGSEGSPRRSVNIPWTQGQFRYRVRTLLNPEDLGEFSGEELQKNVLSITLPIYGQELLELTAILD